MAHVWYDLNAQDATNEKHNAPDSDDLSDPAGPRPGIQLLPWP